MSDEQTTATPATAPKDLTVDQRIAAMQTEIDRLKTNPLNLATTRICNGCGDAIADGKGRCPKHPNEPINHIREATDEERATGKGKLILVKQV